MREHNLWHRSTSIFIIDEFQRICVNKRSKKKDYYPSYLDPAFGGVVGAEEMDTVDLAALREAQEEMGITNLSQLKVPGGHQSLAPKFVFKHKFQNEVSNAWVYTYYIPWHTALKNSVPIKP